MLGQIRREGLCDGVIYSDWRGELDAFPEVRSALNNCGAVVIELPPMRHRGAGNVLTQIRSLSAAMERLSPMDNVLKTRPDLWMSPQLTKRVLRRGVEGVDFNIRSDVPQVFHNKIWVPWFHTARCLHLSDECFHGRVADLWRLQEVDRRFDGEFGPPLSFVHTRRFAPPLMRVFPILDDYFQYYVSTRIMWPHSGRDLTSRFLTAMAEQIPNGRYRIMGSIVSELLTTATFRRILAVYYSLLRWYFVIDAGDAVTDFRIRRRPRPNEMVWPHEFELNLVRGGDVCVRSYDASWLERVLDGAPPGDAGADVAEWMQRFDAEPALATETADRVDTEHDRSAIDATVRRHVATFWAPILRERTSLIASTHSLRGTVR
ncbi:hypothetical protein [Mycolicibacterium doricum]|uniref:hypothetical protein n=1 Tax=Mycolicibacterium doricum TaxID=126673 RepID=UPI001054781C|nr:hypothetical protein [Mycolicibacterium doricum]MCV7266635.1 hypothetical protein [Mycolicibacterium doricum]